MTNQPIYKHLHGDMVQVIDLTKDIPMLKEFINEYDKGLTATVEAGKTNVRFNFYFGQLEAFAKMNPYFPFYKFLNKEECGHISYFFAKTFA